MAVTLYANFDVRSEAHPRRGGGCRTAVPSKF